MDYTTAANVKAYGDVQKAGIDAILPGLVTAYSRQLDVYCQQVFERKTYVDQVLGAQIDTDGVLLCHPAVPTIETISAIAYRAGVARDWYSLDVADVDIEEAISGCTVRVLRPNLLWRRGVRVQVKLSYTGGWAEGEIPADFELIARRLVWWGAKKRESPIETTADPGTGQLIIPSSWPPDIKDALRSYRKVTP